MPLQVGIYIFDEVEVLDFAGPYQVFTTANRMHLRTHPQDSLFAVHLIGETSRPIQTRGGFGVQPHFSIDKHSPLDLLLVPGGVHTAELTKPRVIEWIKQQAQGTKLTASICTGAFLLAKAGLLAGLSVTTHWEDIPDLKTEYPGLNVRENVRWIEHNRIMTSAGISAGTDMSLRIVARLASEALAERTARQMDYEWKKLA